MRPMTYINVPADVIREAIAQHGGLSYFSGELPFMTGSAEDEYHSAAAAPMPSDEITEEATEHAVTHHGSPTSMVHVGAAPPPPPPQPGLLPTPQQLFNSTTSPIQNNSNKTI